MVSQFIIIVTIEMGINWGYIPFSNRPVSKRVGKKQSAISTKLSHGASSDSNSVQLSGWAHAHQELKGSSLIDDQHKTNACLCTHAYIYIT